MWQKKYLIVAFSLSFIYGSTQETFTPVKNNKVYQDKFYRISESELDKKLENYDGEFKKDYKDFIKESKEGMRFLYDNMFYEKDYSTYLLSLLNNIVDNNPELKQYNFRINYFEDPSLNAFNTGEGSIFVNLGIFDYIPSETELAFILCHEISHQVLDHTNRDFEDTKKAYEKEIANFKRAKADNIEAVALLRKFGKNYLYKTKHADRALEAEADSMALIFFKNTKYDIDKGIEGVKNLKEANEDKYDMNKMLRFVFDFPDYPFKDKWTKYTMSMADKMKYDVSDEEKDSLSTHPNTEWRYEKLQKMASKLTSKGDEEISTEKYNETTEMSRKQILYNLLDEENVSSALLYSLNYLYSTEDPYFFKPIYECLQKIEKGLGEHKLVDMVELRNPYYTDEYNKLLTFIDNLNYDEVVELRKHFKQKHNL